MLRSELYELEKVVGAILADKQNDNPSATENKLAEQVGHVRSLCANLRKKWTHEFLSSARESVIKRYVQYHQAGITRLSDELSGKISAQERFSETQKTLVVQVSYELEQVLDFLHHQLYLYFDLDHKVSRYGCQQRCAQLRKYLPEVTGNSQDAIDEALLDTIRLSVEEVIEDALYSGMSYRQFEHILGVLRLADQLLNVVDGVATEKLARALYKQNFNSLHFLQWCQGTLNQQIAKYIYKTDRQEFIDKELLRLASIFVNPDKAFEPDLPSIDKMMSAWLLELSGKAPKAGNENGGANGQSNFPLNLSVHQFAMFTRIFSQAGCFPTANVSKITRFFTGHFTTKKQSHILAKSFGRAFYSLDQSTAAIVRDYLQRMLNYVNKTYFP